MSSARSVGRTVGVLLPLQMAAGLMLPFILIQSMTRDVHGFLATAAGHAPALRAAVLLAFLGGALTVAIAIAAWPVLRRCSHAAALWFLVVCAGSFVMDAVHNATLMSLLSLSREYASASAAQSLHPLGQALASIRYWAHYTQLVFIGLWIATFYVLMLRFALIPRVLAALGLIGIGLQASGVTLPAWVGYSGMPQLAMPLAPMHLATAAWLIVKGFDERRPAAGAEAHEAA